MPESHALYCIHGDNPLDYPPGYVVRTFGLGHDPNHGGGEDMRGRHTVIARLNDGYPPTIPLPQHYEDFAQRCANFVAASQGCTRWIIGNEMNHSQERPDGQPITPDLYARCFNLCRAAIKALSGHENDQVLVGAVAPWNDQTKYPGNPLGDWIIYFEDIQHEIAGCDGFAIHTYAREQTPASVVVTTRMNPPFEAYHNGFQTYTDWMAAILPEYIGLDVYCTETNAIVPWADADTGFVRQAYQEIFTWNSLHPGRPILCLALYRWQYDQWRIRDKPGVIADFYTAVECGYFYPPITDPPVEPEPPEPPIEPPEENAMLQNPSLEGDYTVRDGQGEIQIAPEWNYGYWEDMSHPSHKRPEYRAELRGVDSSRVLEGDKAQKWFWTFGVGEGWIWQRVEGLTPGNWYEFKANVYVWSSDYDDADESRKAGKMWCRLGANPWGDGDARSYATEYGGAIVDNYDHWVELSTVFQAKTNAAAVFLWSSPEHAVKHNDVYWDLASLTEWEYTAPPTEPPDPEPPDPPTGECNVDYERIKLDTQEVVEQALTSSEWVLKQ